MGSFVSALLDTVCILKNFDITSYARFTGKLFTISAHVHYIYLEYKKSHCEIKIVIRTNVDKKH